MIYVFLEDIRRKVNFAFHSFKKRRRSLNDNDYFNCYHTAVLCNLITASKNRTMDNYCVLKSGRNTAHKSALCLYKHHFFPKLSFPQRRSLSFCK
jgi:hypothetical protein